MTAEPPPACRHCGREIRDAGTPHMGGWRSHWVHDPGGYELCDPQRPSTRAEPGDEPQHPGPPDGR